MYLRRFMVAIVYSLELTVSDASMELSLVESHASRKQVVTIRGKVDIMGIMGIK